MSAAAVADDTAIRAEVSFRPLDFFIMSVMDTRKTLIFLTLLMLVEATTHAVAGEMYFPGMYLIPILTGIWAFILLLLVGGKYLYFMKMSANQRDVKVRFDEKGIRMASSDGTATTLMWRDIKGVAPGRRFLAVAMRASTPIHFPMRDFSPDEVARIVDLAGRMVARPAA